MPALEDIHRKYPRQWLAIEVTETDPGNNEPIAGKVLTRAQTREEIWEKVNEFLGRELYVFFTGPLIKGGFATGF